MIARSRAAAALTLALIAPAAQAQYRVDEIVAKGGQVITAGQFKSEIVGGYVSGASEQGFQFELFYSRDGRLEGMVSTPRGSSGLIGTWGISRTNAICVEYTLTASRDIATRCVWYWKAGNEYFSTNSRMDDEAAVKFAECIAAGGRGCEAGFMLGKRSVLR